MISFFEIFILWFFASKNSKKIIVSIIITIYLLFYLLIDIVSSDGINLASYYHFQTNLIGSNLSSYYSDFIVVLLFVILLIILSNKLSKNFDFDISFKNFVYLGIFVILFSQPTFDIYKLIYNLNSFDNNKKILNIENNNFIINKKNKYNLIVVTTESLNSSIWKKFKKNKYKNKKEFNNVVEIDGTNWSVAGLTALNCSLPLIPSKRNQKLQFIYPNQNCLTDILNKSGYENFVIQGTDGRFANQEKLYLTHSVDNKNFIDKRKIINDNLSSWGYHDETIFAEAKSIIKKRGHTSSKKNIPFSIFINTFDTHAPDGYASPKCNVKYSQVKIELEKAFRCVTDEIYKLIKFIDEHVVNETILVIHSDHLLMSNDTNLVDSREKQKNTFEIYYLNFRDKIIFEQINKKGTTLDIGPTILDILSDGKIKKLGLGTSLLDNVNKNFNNYENLVYIYFDSLKELQSLPELLSIELDDTDQLITNYKKKIQIPFVYSVKNKNYFFPSSDINGNINHSHITNLVSKLKNSNDILFLKCKRIKFFENNEKICALSNHNNNLLKIFELKEDIGIELLNKNLLNSKITIDKKEFYNNTIIKQSLVKILKYFLSNKDLKSILNIYHYYKFKFANIFSSNDKHSSSKIKLENNIAHAGGEIDNLFYTNSLQAVNKSLVSGMNMIELDFKLSSDGYLIALHDWESWSKNTGCSISEYPKYDEFLKCKIFKIYNPIGYQQINNLMDKNKDLILVTDKINNPEVIKEQITNYDRVYMELFSEKKVLEAIDLNIKTLISESILYHYLDKNTLQKWIDKIDGVAVSRHTLMRHHKIFKHIKNKNKKIFVFSINDGEIRDSEEEVLMDLKNYITGIYLDYRY